ncbi:hypothetical protein FB554_1975 [Barrientosiimonas humi]|uniref:Uncharacterized protein n=1 Tax=Barrientosiimonas humi TaxID=999931 RepID=A0A542XDA8_9MICO|nr:hypothetical protein [Barrientosiimonas humi]TQL33822.1 hypothetical protein FB554_1975 [Barrientosiimonas humi]CAG7573810.1 hypothetical protein BH39T_PBIAJDOK_02450 [Barrientosiimonas humi]
MPSNTNTLSTDMAQVSREYVAALEEAKAKHLAATDARMKRREDAADNLDRVEDEAATIRNTLDRLENDARKGNVSPDAAAAYSSARSQLDLYDLAVEALEMASRPPKALPNTSESVAEIVAGVLRRVYAQSVPVVTTMAPNVPEPTPEHCPVIVVQQTKHGSTNDGGHIRCDDGIAILYFRSPVYAPLDPYAIVRTGEDTETLFVPDVEADNKSGAVRTPLESIPGLTVVHDKTGSDVVRDYWKMPAGTIYAPPLPVLPEVIAPSLAAESLAELALVAVNLDKPMKMFPIVPVGAPEVTVRRRDGVRRVTTIGRVRFTEQHGGQVVRTTMPGHGGGLARLDSKGLHIGGAVNYSLAERVNAAIENGDLTDRLTAGIGRVVSVSSKVTDTGLELTVVSKAASI